MNAEYQKATLDECQMVVLGTLIEGLLPIKEAMELAGNVSESGGVELFTDEWSRELWQRIGAAINDFKPPHVYLMIKQTSPLPMEIITRCISSAMSGAIVEETYLPELVAAYQSRKVRSALLQSADSGDVDSAMAAIKQMKTSVSKRPSLRELAHEVIGQWEIAAQKENKGRITGIASGLSDLDKLTWGWQKQNLIVIGARPSQGKTAMLIGFAVEAAIEHKIPTVLFSVESSAKEIMRRIVCQMAGADQSRMRGGYAEPEDLAFMPLAIKRITNAPLYIIDCPGINIASMKQQARELKERHGIKLILVDYLQKVKATEKNEKRTYEVAQVSEGLKTLAVELDVPVITAGQLNREPERNKGRQPILSDLADSGQIERDADIIGLLHRNKDGEIWLLLSKFRDGPTGALKLHFESHCAKFTNAGKISTADYPQERRYKE